MDLNNVFQLIFKDDLWCYHDAIVVSNMVVGESNLGSLKKIYSMNNMEYNGHMSISKTLKKILNSFLVAMMSCDVCQHSKAPNMQPDELLQYLNVATLAIVP